MLPAFLTLVIGWAAMAFGAVYAWAIAPVGLSVVALAMWQCRPYGKRVSPNVVGVALLLLAPLVVQLVPLPTATLERISPAAVGFLSYFDVAMANGMTTRHAISIDPQRTVRALVYLGLWILWTMTCVSALSRGMSVRELARNVAIVATVVAVVGLAQKAMFNGKVLWFWTPDTYATNSFGPFVNRNHFAGWMMLAVSLTAGLALGYTSRSDLASRRTWRERMLWLGSPAASPMLITSAAAVVMACALVWTMSRSGIIAMACAATVMTVAAACRSNGRMQRTLAMGYAVSLIAAVLAWRGTETLFAWYGNTGTWQWRVQLWQDTLPALRDYWITGSGLNTYSSLMLIQRRSDMTVQPLQAHNDYLQLAVEGGLLVCVPVLLVVAVIGRRLVAALRVPQEPLTWWVRMGSIAAICGMAVQEISEFSLQIPGVAILFGACLAIALHHPAPLRHSSRAARPAGEARTAA
jgi:O-antigen ligase